MSDDKQRAVETAAYLRERIPSPPRIGFLAGTGLGDSAAFLDPSVVFDYTDLPHFSRSTVQSHKGRLLFGEVAGRAVVAMLGGSTFTKGIPPNRWPFPSGSCRSWGSGP